MRAWQYWPMRPAALVECRKNSAVSRLFLTTSMGRARRAAPESHVMNRLSVFTVVVLFCCGGSGPASAPKAPPTATPTPTVNRPPLAQFAAASMGTAGVPMTFDAAASSDPDNDMLIFAWDFGDGSTGSGITATHAFARAGSYVVTLSVSDGKSSAPFTKTVTVSDAADSAAPAVLSVSPPDGAVGVSEDTTLVINFSESMDKVATQTAYQSSLSGLRAADVTFAWNTEGTQLTVKPNSKLRYASGDAPASTTALRYTYEVSSVATDLAGNALPAFRSSFSTLKRIRAALPSEPALRGTMFSDQRIALNEVYGSVGDTVSNLGMRTFLSFDLSSLPSDLPIANLMAAKLFAYKAETYNSPYSRLKLPCGTTLCFLSTGYVSVDHLNYGTTLNAGDYDAPRLAELGAIDSPALVSSGGLLYYENTTPNGWKSLDVLSGFKDDVTNRAARRQHSQYRLAFQRDTDGNDTFDAAYFYLNASDSNLRPFLQVEYVTP
jgi:PKD repeat protein